MLSVNELPLLNCLLVFLLVDVIVQVLTWVAILGLHVEALAKLRVMKSSRNITTTHSLLLKQFEH
jgi:hypothetical protein